MTDSLKTETWRGIPWEEVTEKLVGWIRRGGVPLENAQDLAQDCVLALRVKSPEIEETPQAYLRGIARNKVRDHIRQKSTRKRIMVPIEGEVSIAVAEPDSTPDPAAVYMLRFLVLRCFRTYDASRRESKTPGCAEIMERTIGGENQFEIAKDCGCSRAAVAKAWERCKLAVREKLLTDPRVAPYLEWIHEL